MKVQGKYNEAIIYTNEIDNAALTQIYGMLNIPAFADTQIRIMPDVHVGKGSVVGFTMTLNDFISPTLVGVDIGCGVNAYNLGKADPNLKEFDLFINSKIPSGRSTNLKRTEKYFKTSDALLQLIEKVSVAQYDRILKSVGTLGGGNHFIELDKDTDGNLWLLIHSGSRYLGLAVYEYHQKIAKAYIKDSFQGAGAYHGFEFMPVKGVGEEYISDLKTTQEYASTNREVMAGIIIEEFFKLKMKNIEKILSTHNYVDFTDNVVRKGAIASRKDEPLVIPLNMRDGILICKGKSNSDWNYSAPHGAGRIFSRGQAKELISLSEYEESMKGIYSSSVNISTIDESPMAYKPKEMILNSVNETVDIVSIARPVYNFKAGE